MSETVCDICGLRNGANARVCARCAEPLDTPTQISPSPFAEPTPKADTQTVIDLPITPPPRAAANMPASARPTQALTQDLEATRIVQSDRPLPPKARPEPAAPPGGLPPVQSRVPTQPLTGGPEGALGPTQKDLAALIQRATAPLPDAPRPPAAAPKPPLRQRLAQLAQEDLGEQAAQPAPTQVARPKEQKLARAVLHQHGVANAIDAAVVLATVWALGAGLLALSGHGYPDSRPTAFENFAVYLARTGSLPWRTFGAAFVLAVVYGGVGALRGVTFGRAVMGLVLVGADGRPVGPGGALWHALGCALNILSLGAGSWWFVVDRSHRTWACLLSRTQVVPRHQLVPR